MFRDRREDLVRQQWHDARQSGSTAFTYRLGGRVFSYTVTWQDFTQAEHAFLLDAIGHVRAGLESAIADLPESLRASGPVAAWLERWFGGGQPLDQGGCDRVRKVLCQVCDAIDRRTLYFSNEVEEHNWHALTDPTGILWGVALDPSFWALGDPRRQTGIVFHELTHRYAWTNDRAGYLDREALDRTDPGPLHNGEPTPACLWPRPTAPTYHDGRPAIARRLRWNASTYQGFLEDYYLDHVPRVEAS
jgi:hypothetical protein